MLLQAIQVSTLVRTRSYISPPEVTCHSSLPNVSDKMRISFDLRYNPIGQPAGRPLFPGFVARSRHNPASGLRDAEAWAQSWYEMRKKLSRTDVPTFNRWPSNDPVCT